MSSTRYRKFSNSAMLNCSGAGCMLSRQTKSKSLDWIILNRERSEEEGDNDEEEEKEGGR
jgi:hypothetical protein